AAFGSWDGFVFVLVPGWLVKGLWYRATDDRVSELSVGAALALLSLLKFSFAFLCAFAALVTAADAIRRRRVSLMPIAFAASLPILWLLAGQPLGAAPDYVRTSLELSGA